MCISILKSKGDNGLFLLEDLKDENRKNGPLISLPKEQIPPAATINLVLKSLARFHGSWFIWFKEQSPKTIGGMNKEELIKCLAFPPSTHKQMKPHFKVQ